MSCTDCRAVWLNTGDVAPAKSLDEAFPDCLCELYSLASEQRTPVGSSEMVVRILTTPHSYSVETREIISAKLTKAHHNGLSVLREGASEQEIRRAIEILVNQAEKQELVGATINCTREIRECSVQGQRAFCVYDTDHTASEIIHHADITGALDARLSRTAKEKQKTEARKKLRGIMAPTVIYANTAEKLIAELVLVGFTRLHAPPSVL